MGKGDWRRLSQVPPEVVAENWEAVFGKKKLNIMSDEERVQMEREKDEIERTGCVGVSDRASGEQLHVGENLSEDLPAEVSPPVEKA